MKKFDFIAGSLVFHAALFIIVLLLPPPFPSAHVKGGDYAFVELTPVRQKAAGNGRLTGTETAAAGPENIYNNAAHPSRNTPSDDNPNPLIPPPGGGGEAAGARRPALSTPQPRPSGGMVKPQGPSVTIAVTDARGLTADKTAINFRYQKGWPVPGMVRLNVDAAGGGGSGWRAVPDEDWIIVSPADGTAPGPLKVGVNTSRLALGYYDGVVKVQPDSPGLKGDEVAVTLMVLPRSPGTPELPHSSWDAYMDGNCKVCHLPKEVWPFTDYMVRPEFCVLCHSPNGMASGKTLKGKGHPVDADINSGGAKMPTSGTVRSGAGSDNMAAHLRDGRLVVCVTCHNVMEKPGDYGRTWEMTSTRNLMTYSLYNGGWEGMGYIEPRVYAASGLMQMPHFLKEAGKYLVDPSEYGYDESDGTITFKAPRRKDEVVYVTLDNPYLRVTVENNRLCYDCHSENTHQGMGCLACHRMHGTNNIMCIRQLVRTPGKQARRVIFAAREGKNSFAAGDAVHDGICEVCHVVRHTGGKDYSGTDCTKCHTHRNGFGR